MSLRTRLLLAFAIVVLIPIALLAFGLRREMTRRLSDQYQRRVDTVADVMRENLAREGDGISQRLASLAAAVQNDNRFRRGAVAGIDSERDYVFEYAGTAMHLTGLSMLEILDEQGEVISSGHFRNEHGRLERGLVEALAPARDRATLVMARGPDRDFVALVRSEPVRIGARSFTLIGGVTVDEAFLSRLARDAAIIVSLTYPGGRLSSSASPQEADAKVRQMQLPLIKTSTDASPETVQAQLIMAHPLTPLSVLLRSADAWFLLTASGAALTALLLAVWVSSRISRPLADLAGKTAVLDLDRLDVDFDAGTDEVGQLSRLLGDLAARLRSSTTRIREAERRATVGDLARQVTHDIKNGLIPLRNVMRHLEQVERDEPAALAAVFAERRQTVDSSIGYLETLATSYARLSPPPVRRECDLNELVRDVVRASAGPGQVEVEARLAESVPPVVGDPIAVRRVLENLAANAVDSLDGRAGRVIITTEVIAVDGERRTVRLTVADTGRGMSREESAQIFNDFYTTKAGGTGLGLSIVRRLVMDLHGALGVESEPGMGTRIRVEIPAGRARERS